MASYAEKLGGLVNSTLVGLALTLSKDVGILQVLLDARKPLTSHEITGERDLKERYVRELLACLATAEVIHVSTDGTGTLVYYLEEDEKPAFRTRAMALMSYPKAMMKGFDQIKSCFSKTGPHELNAEGLNSSAFRAIEVLCCRYKPSPFVSLVDLLLPVGFRLSTEFHDCVEEYGPYNFDLYVDAFLKSVDGLQAKLESGIDVMEVGCGRGRLLAKIAQMFPKSKCTASDNVDCLLAQQTNNLGHIPNIQYNFLDLCSPAGLPSQKYDWVYCVNVIHDVPNPPEALQTIKQLLKPDGTFTMIEFATSGSPLGDRGNIQVASVYAISSYMSVAESFQREDSHAMGAGWGKQRVIDFATAAGFRVNAVVLDYPITLFVCK